MDLTLGLQQNARRAEPESLARGDAFDASGAPNTRHLVGVFDNNMTTVRPSQLQGRVATAQEAL